MNPREAWGGGGNNKQPSGRRRYAMTIFISRKNMTNEKPSLQHLTVQCTGWGNSVSMTWPKGYNMHNPQTLHEYLTILKFESTSPNMWQHVTTGWPNSCNIFAPNNVLCLNVAIVWPGLKTFKVVISLLYRSAK